MKYLVTGYNGQLGYDIVKKLKTDGENDILYVDKDEMDITNQDNVNEVILRYNPDVIFHCAAFTAVDKAEEMKEACEKVNVLGTKYITEASIKTNSTLVYISTDYVFDGKKEDVYTEEDLVNPKSVYGMTKYLGEVEVSKNPKHFIARVSWVFGINGNNFIRTMLKLGETKKELNIVADQIGSPTYTVDLSNALANLIKTDKYGLYNITNEDYCSWAEFAEYIFESNNIDLTVNKIPSSAYPQKAYRPKNSKLSKEKLYQAGINKMPTWKNAVDRYNIELEKEKKMKVLVTGGAGFIGSNFMHYMVNKYPNYDFVCIDALTYAGNYNNIKVLENKNNFKFVKGSITDRDLVFDLFDKENFDWVINFAAESHVDNSIKNPGIFLETNIMGTQILMDASRKYNVKRYHQVSTDEVYGDLPLDKPDLLFTEQTPIHTSSPYSASKASADLLVMAYMRTFKLPATISRCSNNYGPYQFPEKLIPVVISKALNNENIPVYGKGENVRDWIHVYDHNTGIDKIMHEGKIGEVYNLGGRSERQNIEVVKTILKHMNKDENLITYVTDRAGHDLRYAIDSSKSERELNWDRTYNFEQGLAETIDWYLDNENWINDIKFGKYKESYTRVLDKNN